MAAHFVVVAALYCTVVNPAVDQTAGAFPKLLPLQIAVTISDAVCVAVLHAPTLTSILGIVSDVRAVIGDLPPRDSFAVTSRPPKIGRRTRPTH